MIDRKIKEKRQWMNEWANEWKQYKGQKWKIGEKVHTERDRTKCKRLTGQSGMKAN